MNGPYGEQGPFGMTGGVGNGDTGMMGQGGITGPQGMTGPDGSSPVGPNGVTGPQSATTDLVYSQTNLSVSTSGVYLNNIFSSTYDVYRLVATYIRGAEGLRIKLSSGGVAVTGNTNYRYFLVDTGGSSGGSTASGISNEFGGITYTQGGGETTGGIWTIFNPYQTTYTTRVSQDQNQYGGLFQTQNTGAVHKANTSFDGLFLYADSATKTVNLQIYGYPKT
jgi:hypothetical protein